MIYSEVKNLHQTNCWFLLDQQPDSHKYNKIRTQWQKSHIVKYVYIAIGYLDKWAPLIKRNSLYEQKNLPKTFSVAVITQ